MSVHELDDLKTIALSKQTLDELRILSELDTAANMKARIYGEYPAGVGVVLWQSNEKPSIETDEVCVKRPGSFNEYYKYAVYCKATNEIQPNYFDMVGKT
ncbi:MAG: hypothetical protein OQL08_07970 [Gammaproteobacteria bacterium]|nr:hypothetical protein [Gammaproteobacteria bacterium]